jgi:hypothetical protein
MSAALPGLLWIACAGFSRARAVVALVLGSVVTAVLFHAAGQTSRCWRRFARNLEGVGEPPFDG